jgi:type VI secretion system protein
LSRQHFIIRLIKGRYWIEDTSTNGVIVNEVVALEHHQPVQLNDGDRIRLGHYEIAVSLNKPTIDATRQSGPRNNWPEEPYPWPAEHEIVPEIPPTEDQGYRKRPESNHVPAIKTNFPPPTPQPEVSPTANISSGVPKTPDDIFNILDRFVLHQASRPATPQGGPARPAESDPAPTAATPPPEQAHPAAPSAPAASDALGAFLLGAGIEPGALTDTDSLAVLTRAGEILRESIEGLIKILNARNMTKAELRVERTVLQPADNNPLKFSSGIEGTLITLLDGHRPGFMDSTTATRDAARDILAHEFALLAAIPIALNSLLERFRPENLTERIQADDLFASLFSVPRKARYWEVYEKKYQKIAEDMANNFNGVFGDALTDAYLRQLSRLEEEPDEASMGTRSQRRY